MRDPLHYRLLGPLVVERGGQILDLGTPKQRALLAVLAQDAGTTVSTDRIVDRVWGDDHPASVVSSLHANISRLRRLLRDDPSSPPPIVRRSGGYLLDVDRAELDVVAFGGHADAAAAAADRGDWPGTVAAAEQALGLWRGGYLDDLRDEEWVRVAAAPLNERRGGTEQTLVVALLGVGDVGAALARSTALLTEHPLVERAAWLHMTALHRAGRTADALETFRMFAARIDDELGLDVGPALRDLHSAILRQDPDLLQWPRRRERGGVPSVVEPARAATTVHGPAPTTATSLVGRADELAVIETSLSAARTDSARWVVVAGPPGIGKTRIADEAIARWAATGGAVARGQCPDLDEVPAWWPVRQILRGLDIEPDAVLGPSGRADADAARFAVYERVTDAVRAAVATTPRLIVVDDIHWGDRDTLTFLTVLAETVHDPGLAVVLTTRQTRGRPEFDRLLEAVARRHDSRQLTLGALAAEQVGQLVEQVSGEPPDEADLAGLATRTGGTPFFVIEYARLPVEQRRGEQIPAAVRTVLRRRFAGLPDDVRSTLEVAAVLGEPINVPVLAAALRRDEDEVADLLDTAADLDMLTASLDTAAYGFAHALLRDELATAVPDLRRRRLHGRAAELLRDASGFADVLRRARHLQAAGPLAPADVAYAAFRAAAVAADERWLAETAATWWKATAAAFDRTADGDPLERDAVVGAQLRAMAWAGQGQAVLDALDDELVVALREGRTASVGRLAANLLRVSGSWPWPVYGSDPAPLISTLSGLDTALQADPAARARVLAVAAIGRCYDPDPAVPDGLSSLAIQLAEQTGDPAVLADALLGRALTYAGVAVRSQESLDLLERLSTLRYPGAEADDVLRRNIATMALLNLGRMTECAEYVHSAALSADVLRMPVNRVQLRWAEAALAQWQGDLRRAAELYGRAELAHRRTDLQQSGTFERAELSLLWEQGRLDELAGPVPGTPMVSQWAEAVADCAAGRPGGRERLAVEIRRFEPEVWTSHGRWALLSHCVADAGLRELAPPLLAAMAPMAGYVAAFGQCGTLGPMALAMARLSRLIGDHAAAREQLATATELAERSGGAGALLHCRVEAAARAASDGGVTEELRHDLVALAREADDRGMTGVARRVRELY